MLGSSMATLDAFLAALLQFSAQAAPWLVLGYVGAGIMREYVPTTALARWFKGGGILAHLRASFTGALLPMCSCTVLPVSVSLSRAGAAPGSVLAFLLSAPAISPVSVLLAVSLLGPLFAACFLGSALLIALLAGLLGDRLLPPAVVPAPVAAVVDQRTWRQRGRSAANWAFRDLAPEVSLDLVVGFAIAAAVLAVLPMGWVASWLGQRDFATLVYVILIGIPMYTCTVPSLPVVQSLMLAGMSPGAGVAFLIAGPVTNIGELMVMRRTLGGRATVLFVAVLGAGSLAAGLAVDHLVFAGSLATAGVAAPVAGCCLPAFMPGVERAADPYAALATIPTWHWPFVAILAVTMLIGVAKRIQHWRAPQGESCPLPAATS